MEGLLIDFKELADCFFGKPHFLFSRPSADWNKWPPPYHGGVTCFTQSLGLNVNHI